MATDASLILIYSPFPDSTAALHAARTLLEEKLIACANILEGGTSLYRTAEVMTETREKLLFAKTTQAQKRVAMQRLAELHPYETPAILALDAEANASYAAWVSGQVKPA